MAQNNKLWIEEYWGISFVQPHFISVNRFPFAHSQSEKEYVNNDNNKCNSSSVQLIPHGIGIGMEMETNNSN